MPTINLFAHFTKADAVEKYHINQEERNRLIHQELHYCLYPAPRGFKLQNLLAIVKY